MPSKLQTYMQMADEAQRQIPESRTGGRHHDFQRHLVLMAALYHRVPENTRRPQRPSSFSSGQLRGGYSAAPSCRAASSCSGWAWISPTAMFPPAYTMPASFQPRQSSSAL